MPSGFSSDPRFSHGANMGLREIFAELPGGGSMPRPMDTTHVLDVIRRKYISGTSEDSARRMAIRRRLDLYANNVGPYVEAHIRRIFSDPKIIDERLKVLSLGKWQNLTKRVVNELARVYSNPARRTVGETNAAGVDTGGSGYEEFIDHLDLDGAMRMANRLSILCNQIFLYIRTEEVDSEVVPALDLITSDQFSVVPHPLYPLRMAAILIGIASEGGTDDTSPHYMLISSDEIWYLNRAGFLISEKENVYGFIPGILVHSQLPHGSLLDARSGDDIMTAHESVVLLNVLAMNAAKVSTKVPYVQGDSAYTAQGQTMDQTSTVMLGDGMMPGVIDLRSDPHEYIKAAASITMQLAASYGIPEDFFNRSFTGTTGIVMDAKLSGLMERRNEQLPIFRRVERELARKASIICSRDCAPRFHFSDGGWQIDFGEITRPQDPLERLRWRKEARSMGLRTIIDDLQEDNPDLDTERAWARLTEIIEIRSAEVEAMRALNMPRDPSEPGLDPAQNGAANSGDQGEQDAATILGDN